MNTGLWNMGSGFTAARRPGMTVKRYRSSASAPISGCGSVKGKEHTGPSQT
jgi:hypothetical protein